MSASRSEGVVSQTSAEVRVRPGADSAAFFSHRQNGRKWPIDYLSEVPVAHVCLSWIKPTKSPPSFSMWFLVQLYEPLVFFSKFEIAFFQILRADRGQPATFPCPSGIRFRLQMGCVGHGPPHPVFWQQTNHMGTVLFRRNTNMNTHGVEPARAATAGRGRRVGMCVERKRRRERTRDAVWLRRVRFRTLRAMLCHA